MSKKIKFKGIPFKSFVKIDIGGGFAARVQELTVHYMAQKTPEESAKLMDELKTREPKDEYEYHMMTLLVLLHEIESEAQKQGILEDMEIDVPDVPTES